MSAALEQEAILVFEDDPGTDRRRSRSAESKAAEFLLEHRHGARQRSISDGARLLQPHPGRPLNDTDHRGTCELIVGALEVLPASWQPAVLVAAGWRIGVRGLQDPAPGGGDPWLKRAGFPVELPQGLTRASLASFTRTFRDALFTCGLVRQGVEVRPAAALAVRYVQPTLLEGEDAIAWYFKCSTRTVRRWIAAGCPAIQKTPTGRVRAHAEDLEAWSRGVAATDDGDR